MYIIAGTSTHQPHAVEVQHPRTVEAVSTVGTPSDFRLSDPHFFILYRTLRTSGALALWKDIGLFLKLDRVKLNLIETEEHKAPACLEKVLSLWFTKINPPPTKSAIINVLTDLELTKEAEELQQELVPECC